MQPNANERVRRNKQIRLLRKIRDLKSFAIRHLVANTVLGHSWSAIEFDALLSDQILQGAIVVAFRHRKNRRAGRPLKGRLTRVHRKFRPGRPPRLFKLTRKGHALLKRLLKQNADERAAIAQAREDARLKREQAAQARAEKKIQREAAEATRKAARIAKDLTRRTASFELPPTPQAPVRRAPVPQATPRPYPGPSPTPPAGFNRPAPPMATTPIGGPSLAHRIRKAGYRTNERGQVLYDNRWIEVSEWRSKMPHIDLT